MTDVATVQWKHLKVSNVSLRVVEVTLRLKASQSVSVGLATRYYFLSEICGLVSVRGPL
jgi:hypothetical protein